MVRSTDRHRTHTLLHVPDGEVHLDRFAVNPFHSHKGNTFHNRCHEHNETHPLEDNRQEESMIVLPVLGIIEWEKEKAYDFIQKIKTYDWDDWLSFRRESVSGVE